MSRATFSAPTPDAVVLTAATAKTVLGWQAPEEHGLSWLGFEASLNGVTSTEAPVLVELCRCTFATAGTSSAVTEAQESGRSVAIPGSAFYNFTAEPTVITPVRNFFLTPVGGLAIVSFDEGEGWDCDAGEGFVIRLTPGAAITGSFRGSMRVARI